MEQGEETGDKKWSAIVRNFTQETTFHGVKYIAADTRFKSRRITWVIIILGVISTFTYAVVTSVLHYYEYPSSIELQVGYLEEVPFPAITICNENPYRLTASHRAGLYDVITQTYDRLQHDGHSHESGAEYYMINPTLCNLPQQGVVFELTLGNTSISVCKDLCSGYKTHYCSGFLYDVTQSQCTLTSYTGEEDMRFAATNLTQLQDECANRRVYFYRRMRSIDDNPIYCNYEEGYSPHCTFFDDTLRAKVWFRLQSTEGDITFGTAKGHYLFVHDITKLLSSSAEIHTMYINTTDRCLFVFVKILGTGFLSLKVSAISESLTSMTVAYINSTDIQDGEQDVWRRVFKVLPDGKHKIAIEALFGPNSDGEFFLDDINIDACASMTKYDSCIRSDAGSEYIGQLSTNNRNETCAIWKEVVSFQNFTQPLDVLIPDASWEDAYNHCRFVHGLSMTSPGCFNEELEFVSCSISRCPCYKDEFRCDGSGMCIPTATTCDSESICVDGSDEGRICACLIPKKLHPSTLRQPSVDAYKNSVACDFSDPFICGYKQVNNIDQLLWTSQFDASDLSYFLQLETEGYVIPGLSVRLLSRITSVNNNVELSISFNPFYSSENSNVFSVWFGSSLGDSVVPVIVHDHSSFNTEVEQGALFEKEIDGGWVRYKTCLPGSEDTSLHIVIEALYNGMDDGGFQIGDITLNDSNCTLHDGYSDTVLPHIDSTECDFDEDLCSYVEFSDHVNLTWTLLPQDTVAAAMYHFNQTAFLNLDCDLCLTYGNENYDFIYFEKEGTIQSTNFPENYPNFALDRWLIKGSYGVRIYIEFIFLAIEKQARCNYDALEIKDLSNGKAQTYCGILLPDVYTSEGHLVQITFTSDYIVNGPGFQLQYFVTTEKNIDKAAVLSYTAPYYTESSLFGYLLLNLVKITGQGCLTFDYINLGKFTVNIQAKPRDIEVYDGDAINFPHWKKVYFEYDNTKSIYLALLFTVEVPGVLGRQMALALNNLELNSMSCSELKQKGKVVKLVNVVPMLEREKYQFTSQVTSLSYSQVVSIHIAPLQSSDKNALFVWLKGSHGHSAVPILVHDGNHHFSDDDSPLLIDVDELGTNYKIYNLCLPAGDNILVFEAVLETLDDVVINNITLTGNACDVPINVITTVFPLQANTTCSKIASSICPFSGFSDHSDLKWLNIREDTVTRALSLNYEDTDSDLTYQAEYESDIDRGTEFDQVYFALNGIIRSPVYTSVRQTQFFWLVETPADTIIDFAFVECNLDATCSYQISIKEVSPKSYLKTILCGECSDYLSATNQVYLVYERDDPGDLNYGFILEYHTITDDETDVTGSAWILHYCGQLTDRPYTAKLVTPLIESTGEGCLLFDYVSQTELTVRIRYANGSYTSILVYTEVPSNLLWTQFSLTIDAEVGSKYYLEFEGVKGESFSKRYYLAVASLEILNSSCQAVDHELSENIDCDFDSPDWCGYRELDPKESPGWVSKYRDDSFTDLRIGLSSKGHDTLPGVLTYLWSPPQVFPHNSAVSVTLKDNEQKVSLWLHGTFGLSHSPIDESNIVTKFTKSSTSYYRVCIPGGNDVTNITQQLIVMAEYTGDDDILIESIDVTSHPCKEVDETVFQDWNTNCSTSAELCSFIFLPGNTNFTWSTIWKNLTGEAASITIHDGQLVYDGDYYQDIFFTLTGQISMSTLNDISLKWLIIMPDGVGVQMDFDYLNVGYWGDPCETKYLKITDGSDNNTQVLCGTIKSHDYSTMLSKVWIIVEEEVEEVDEEIIYDSFFPSSAYEEKLKTSSTGEGFTINFNALYNAIDRDSLKEISTVLYKGESSEYDQTVRLISSVFVTNVDHCLSFNYQSAYQFSVALLTETGTEVVIFDDESESMSFWSEVAINIEAINNDSFSIVVKAKKKPNSHNVYFVFLNNMTLYPQSCDLINFKDSSVNCSFTENNCGYFDISGQPSSKWFRGLCDETITGSLDHVCHFQSKDMTHESSHLLSPMFTISEDSCLTFRVFQIHKACIVITFYQKDKKLTESIVMECSYKQIDKWTDMSVDVSTNVTRFSLSVVPNRGFIQELYIDDITLQSHPCQLETDDELNQNVNDLSTLDQIDITTTYVSEADMYYVLVEPLGMSWHSVVEDLSHGIADSLLSCYWDGEECEDYMINETMTDMGNCISFNTHHKTLSSERSGSQHGLKMTLNTETYEHIAGIGTDSGFKIQFYNQPEIPIMERKGQVVSPGIHAMFTLNYEESKFLEPEYGTCGRVDLPEYPGLNYTTTHCLTQCLTQTLEGTCHCRLPYMPESTEENTECSVQNYLQCVLVRSRNSSATTNKCNCPDSCEKILFEGQMSYSALSGLAIHSIIGTKENEVKESFANALDIEKRLDQDAFSSILRQLTDVIEIIESLELFVQVRINVLVSLLSHGYERIIDITQKDLTMSTSEIILADQIYRDYIKQERISVVSTYQDLPKAFWEFVHYFKWNHHGEDHEDRRELQTRLDDLVSAVDKAHSKFDGYVFLYTGELNGTTCDQQASDLSKFPYCPNSIHLGVSETYFPVKAVLGEDISTVCATIADYVNNELSDFEEDYPLLFYGTGREEFTVTFPESYKEYASVLNTSIVYANHLTELLDNLTVCLTEYGTFLDDTMSWRESVLVREIPRTDTDFSSVADLQPMKVLMHRLHDSYANGEIKTQALSETLLNGNGLNSKTSPSFIEDWITTFSDQFDQYVTDMRSEFGDMTDHHEAIYTNIVNNYADFLEYLGTGTNDSNIKGLHIFRNPRPQVLSSEVKYLLSEQQVAGLTSGDLSLFLNKHSLGHVRDNLAGYFEDLNYLLVEYKAEKDSVTGNLLTAVTGLQDMAQQYLDTIELQPAFVQDNILQVDVYYAELKYSRTEQKVAYGVGDFFSDLGGFLGLLLGASIITVFELLDLIIYNIIESRSLKRKVTPQQGEEAQSEKVKKGCTMKQLPTVETIVVKPCMDN